MNTLKGTIFNIETYEGISLVQLNSLGNILTSVVIDTPDTANYLKEGKVVNILFKETEVMIAKEFFGCISIQNKIPCTIKSVKTGKILCELELTFGDTNIKSIITSNACKQLQLTEGEKVIALIKSNEISLATND